MYTIDSCPCCLSGEFVVRSAIVAPFLSHYAVGAAPFSCKLLECLGCSFRFFNVRLTPDEVDRLYSGYRGERYFAERHHWEFWYSKEVNDGIGGDPEEIAQRVRALEGFLLPHMDGAEIMSVLDYGGDRGQFIPQSLGTRKIVFELSDAQPITGVERIKSEQELNGMKFDLIMALGVLEHCSDPANVLEKLRPYLAARSFLCIGVPYERYNVGFVGNGGLYRRYLDTLLHFPKALAAVDLYSTIGRVRLGGIPPLGLVKCHEHLNFFDSRSMNALLERSGFQTVASRVESSAKYPAPVKSLQVLARLT